MPVAGLFLDPEAMEVPENFKYLQKLGLWNIVQYSAANVPFPEFFSSDIHFFHTVCHVYRSVWHTRQAKPCFTLTFCIWILKLTYSSLCTLECQRNLKLQIILHLDSVLPATVLGVSSCHLSHVCEMWLHHWNLSHFCHFVPLSSSLPGLY